MLHYHITIRMWAAAAAESSERAWLYVLMFRFAFIITLSSYSGWRLQSDDDKGVLYPSGFSVIPESRETMTRTEIIIIKTSRPAPQPSGAFSPYCSRHMSRTYTSNYIIRTRAYIYTCTHAHTRSIWYLIT